MRPPRCKTLAVLALLALLSPLHAGTEILLYPLARAFGGPSESELVQCRRAFQHLQSSLATSRLVVQPVLSQPKYSPENQAVWRHDLAAALRREIGAKSGVTLAAPETTPVVAPTDFGPNQMRYLWSRAAAYAKWVRSTHPAGDYVLFAEVFARNGRVGAIQVFILDSSSGQLAYCRLFNSHQFGPHLPAQGDQAIGLIVQHLFDDLTQEPKKIFPPYGVG